MTFYSEVFGGELDLNTFAEFGVNDDPADAEKIMHGQVTSPSGLVLMGADVTSGMEHVEGNNFAVSLSGEDETELRGYWDKLADGATIVEPLVKAPWGDTFGMLVDRFGINWMVNIAGSTDES
ncbi:VOC family protein [Mycetocola manganoxydans]|nr:VOC family protein [Mycetocola manganoxydans]